jgi:hypothetical protein
MSRDDEWREKFRVSMKTSMERRRLAHYDPYELGLVKEMIEIVWLASRDLSQAQSIALANLLRDVADNVESRWK